MSSELLQLTVNGLMAGSTIALPAVGLSLIFAVQRITNFSMAAHVAVGAFVGYVSNTYFGVPFVGTLIFAFILAGLVGVFTDRIALQPLRGGGPLIVAIGSMALNMVLENALRMLFGNDVRSLDVPIMRDVVWGNIRIAPQQFENLGLAVVAMGLLFGLLTFTSIGRAMRAVADNPQLADIKGIDPRRISTISNFIGMGLGGASGIILATNTAITPDMGFLIIISVFAAAVVGGLGNVTGAVVGAILIGVAEEWSTLILPVNYRSAIGFVAIIMTLALLPRGILGGRQTI
ncbi:branched-chain amino acid ABC transporter permease [Bosea sp. (in: a-proteobacteria)]|uniref:branched-chain amino acid ABC transporter permease n=1 Tax=Bosea sp. (in: a-proteobacteria) TaxID=1871050 RepID=UPI00262EF4D9|nr:branched-chain amino acid ABC transporter permease [Bosea sp. (in: a-proteobacteria)]MCO5091324.1 branched-chain amino acid ABC transporter permease [Bosea sp. (in: a-proteobacteria)]